MPLPSPLEIVSLAEKMKKELNGYIEALVEALHQLTSNQSYSNVVTEKDFLAQEDQVAMQYDRLYKIHSQLLSAYQEWKDTLSLGNHWKDVPTYEGIQNLTDAWRFSQKLRYVKPNEDWIRDKFSLTFRHIDRVKVFAESKRHEVEKCGFQNSDDASTVTSNNPKKSQKTSIQVHAPSEKCHAKIVDHGIVIHYRGGKDVDVPLEPRLVRILESAYRNTLEQLNRAAKETANESCEIKESFYLLLTQYGVAEAVGESDRKKYLIRQDVSNIRKSASFADGKGVVGEFDGVKRQWQTTIPFSMGDAPARPKCRLFSELTEEDSPSQDLGNLTDDKIA